MILSTLIINAGRNVTVTMAVPNRPNSTMAPTPRYSSVPSPGKKTSGDSPHRVVATAHHRAHKGIGDTIRAFSGSDEAAHQILARRRIGFVMMCPGQAEVQFYRQINGSSFADNLAEGTAPDWLMPPVVAVTARLPPTLLAARSSSIWLSLSRRRDFCLPRQGWCAGGASLFRSFRSRSSTVFRRHRFGELI